MPKQKTLLLIGGDPIPRTITALEQALSCKVLWPETPRSRTPKHITTRIDNASPAAVLIYLKCISHETSWAVYKTCRAKSIPCVKLTSGYSPNQVRQQLEKQAPSVLLGVPQ